jgi:hypothetical protein
MHPGDGHTDALIRDGQPYASVHLGDGTTLESVAATVDARLARDPDLAGVVLRCPATHTGRAQRLADELPAESAATERTGRTLEKVGSAVVGEHADLEYRLYLREED